MRHTPPRTEFKPIYQVIKDEVIADVRSGRLRPHDPLASRHELIKKYECSWATVHRAISELILEGVLYAQQGKGTFVAPRPIDAIKVLSLHPIPSWHHSLVEMMQGLQEASYEAAIGLTVINLPHQVPSDYDLDGHVVLTPAVDDAATLVKAAEQGARFIILGSDYPENTLLPCVNADTRAGTKRAVQQLIEAGHRKIGLIGVLDAFPNYQREIEGYEDALRGAGLPVIPKYILSRSHPDAEFPRRIAEWFAAHPEVTAVFAADYATALTLFQFARERGINIPADLSLIAMDELPTADLLAVPPVRVVQPFREMGRLAIKRLVAAITSGTNPRGTDLLECSHLPGDSVRALE